jgi:hypothetical protein
VDALYATLLIVAAVAGAASLVSSSVALARASQARGTGSGLWPIASASLGTFSLFASLGTHWLWGHGPRDAAPMDLAPFVSAHPSFVVIALALVVAEILFVVARAKSAKKERPHDAA